MDAQERSGRSYTPCPVDRHSKKRPLHLRQHGLVEIGEGLAAQPVEERVEPLRADLFERGLGREPIRLRGFFRLPGQEARIHNGQIGRRELRLQFGPARRNPLHVEARARQRPRQLVVRSIVSQKGSHAAHPAPTPLADASLGVREKTCDPPGVLGSLPETGNPADGSLVRGPAIMRLLTILFLALTACSFAPKAPKEKRASIVFVSDLWGQLEPCGCSADMKGGLDRMATVVAELRGQGPVLLVDAGDALFDQASYTPEEEVQARLRAGAVAKGLLAMGLDAKVVRERDAVIGGDWLPASLQLSTPTLREVGGIRVGLLPVDAPHDAEEVGKAAEALRRQGAELVIALLHQRRSEAAPLHLPQVDLAVGSHMESIPEGDRQIAIEGETPLLYPLGRGQGALVVEIALRETKRPFGRLVSLAEGEEEREALGERIRAYEARIAALPAGADASPFEEKIEELRERRRALAASPALPAEGNQIAYRFVTISQDIEPNEEVRQILAAYDREVGEANLAYARENPRPCPEPAEGEATFVGQAACAACHPTAQTFWESTAHAKAYETLENANKQYDLSCISCHVTGWDRPGGACQVDKVEGRKDVGCEACHGPGSLHVAAPSKENIALEVSEQSCRSCHRPDHSLEFDYATYLGRILGPGHGAAHGSRHADKAETP